MAYLLECFGYSPCMSGDDRCVQLWKEGDSKTLMITQISPIRKNEGKTICSLNFAQRVRNVELGTAMRKVENVNSTESDSTSTSRIPLTLQSGYLTLNPNSLTNTGTKCSTTSFNPMTMKSITPSGYMTVKQNTPLSSSKRTPIGRKMKKQ